MTSAAQVRGRHQDGWIKQGATALDTATGQVGEVQQIRPGYDLGNPASSRRERGTVWRRPCGGGTEWTAQAGDLRPAEARAA